MIKLTKKEAGMILRPVKEKHEEVAYLLSRTENEKLKKHTPKKKRNGENFLKKLKMNSTVNSGMRRKTHE